MWQEIVTSGPCNTQKSMNLNKNIVNADTGKFYGEQISKTFISEFPLEKFKLSIVYPSVWRAYIVGSLGLSSVRR